LEKEKKTFLRTGTQKTDISFVWFIPEDLKMPVGNVELWGGGHKDRRRSQVLKPS